MSEAKKRKVMVDVLSLGIAHLSDFPDEAFEGFSNPKAKKPCCAICEGSLRAGMTLLVLDKGRIAHLSCYEGSKVAAKKAGARKPWDSSDPETNGVVSLAKALVAATKDQGQPKVFEAGLLASEYGGPFVKRQDEIATDDKLVGQLVATLKKLGWKGTKPVYDPKTREWAV